MTERLNVKPDRIITAPMNPGDVVEPEWDDRHTRRSAPSEGSRRCMIYRDGVTR